MPAKYTAIKTAAIAKGMPVKQAEAKAAAIYNGTRPQGTPPVTNKSK